MQKRLNRGILYLIAGLCLIFIGMSIIAARLAIFPWWYEPKDVGVQFSECSPYMKRVYKYCVNPEVDLKLKYTSFEENIVAGWVVQTPVDQPRLGTVILVHGGGRDRRSLMRHVPYLYRAGFSTVLIDCWNQGMIKGDGRGISFGLKESESVLSALEYAEKAGLPKPFYLMGTSQGAFTSLFAGSKTNAIRGIISENSYINVKRLLLEYPAMEWLPRASKRLTVFLLSFWLDRSLDELDVGQFADHIRVPVLLIHGDNDKDISVQHSKDIMAFLPNKQSELWVVPGGDHEYLWNQDPKTYERRVLDFLTKNR